MEKINLDPGNNWSEQIKIEDIPEEELKQYTS